MKLPVVPLLALLLALLTAACAPALDWREVQPPGAGLQLLLPCKPTLQERRSETGLRMGLARCEAADVEFALSWSELPDPLAAGAALSQMRASLLRELGGRAQAPAAFVVRGMTPSPEALSQVVAGTSQARLAVFSKGGRVYQLLARSAKPVPDGAWQELAGSIRMLD